MTSILKKTAAKILSLVRDLFPQSLDQRPYDHIIIGNGNRASLRELGYFYN